MRPLEVYAKGLERDRPSSWASPRGSLRGLLALVQVIDVVIRSPVDDLLNGANAGASSVCTPPGAGAEGYVRSISLVAAKAVAAVAAEEVNILS